MIVEAVRLEAVRMCQTGDLGRGEYRRDEDSGEEPASRTDSAFSQCPDHFCPVVTYQYRIASKYMTLMVSIQP